jgi:uncharacterized Zn finger protein (UPF0148 family)
MKIKILGVCDKCGNDLIINSRGRKFCPNCSTNEAIRKFNNKEDKNDAGYTETLQADKSAVSNKK